MPSVSNLQSIEDSTRILRNSLICLSSVKVYWCISAHLLKTRNSTKPNILTFVVTYAPTEEALEGQETKYMAALKSTVASMLAREYIYLCFNRREYQDRQKR